MKITQPIVISFSLLAFASASAYADDAKKSTSGQSSTAAQKDDFSKLDRNNDGSVSRIEAAADGDAKSRFDKLDRNKDQKLSRSEYQAWGSAAAGATSAKSGQARSSGSQLQASELIGKKVSDSQGADLGEIKDVVIDLQAGKVHAAVLDFGGVLGVGEKQYAFPVSELKPGKDDKLVLNIDKQKLKNAEGFAQNQWPAMNDEYWGRVGAQGKAGTGSSSSGQGKSQTQKMTLVRASEMIGKEVQDRSGREVGEITDMIVDLNGAQLKNVVIDLQGAGQAKVQAKSLSTGTGDKLVLDVSADQLKRQAASSK